MTFFVIAMFLGLMWVNYSVNHIPKRGRAADASGKAEEAVIVNSAALADRSATLRVKYNGRTYKVKMKPTEAHLWIKGDKVKIMFSDDKKRYRILFGEYFRENEDRIRDYALKLLQKKVKVNAVAAKMTNYTNDSFEAIKESNMESQRIYSFMSLMHILDLYTVFTAGAAVLFVVWCLKAKPALSSFIVPLIAIAILAWMLYNTCESCKGIIKKAENGENNSKNSKA